MTHRDEHGHFISDEEWERRQSAANPPEEPVEEPTTERRGWTDPAQSQETLFIDTGRGNTVEVSVGSPFQSTVERVAEDAHYGGYYRVYLNGSEIVHPEEAPQTIESGMRIVITSYDKVG